MDTHTNADNYRPAVHHFWTSPLIKPSGCLYLFSSLIFRKQLNEEPITRWINNCYFQLTLMCRQDELRIKKTSTPNYHLSYSYPIIRQYIVKSLRGNWEVVFDFLDNLCIRAHPHWESIDKDNWENTLRVFWTQRWIFWFRSRISSPKKTQKILPGYRAHQLPYWQ